MRALREVWKRSKSSVWGMPRDGSAASASFVRRTPPVPPPGPPGPEVKVVSTSISNLRDGGGGSTEMERMMFGLEAKLCGTIETGKAVAWVVPGRSRGRESHVIIQG